MRKWFVAILVSLLMTIVFSPSSPVQATGNPPPPYDQPVDVFPMITPAPRLVATQGQDILYYLGMGNSSVNAAANATLTTVLPEGTVFKSYTSRSPDCFLTMPTVGGTGSVQAKRTVLPGHGLVDTDLLITPRGPSRTISITAVAASDSPDANPTNNSMTRTIEYQVPPCDLSITVTDGQTTVAMGSTNTYTIVIANAGPARAEDIVVTANLPAGFANPAAVALTSGFTTEIKATASGLVLTVKGADLPSGQSVTATVTGLVTGSPGDWVMTASASTVLSDPDLTNNSATDMTGVVETPPSIVSGKETITGEATPAAANGKPAAVPFTGDMAGWFSDVLNRPLSFKMISAMDNATEPHDVSAQVSIAGGKLTYTPAAAQGGRTVTILVKANNGISDSKAAVTVQLTVHPVPPNLYRIDFDPLDGKPAPAFQTIADGGKVVKPAEMTRKGYAFVGWFLETTLSTPWDFAVQTVSGPVTLHAGWQKVQYSITYHLDGGVNASANPAFFTISDESITLQAPIKDGYRFDGWFDAAEAGTPVTSIATQNPTAVTLYAHWTLLEPIPVTGEMEPVSSVLLGAVLLLGAIWLLTKKHAWHHQSM